jgi:sugar transferase (PEP-CTERM system associated)
MLRHFQHHVPPQFRWLAIAEFIAFAIAVYLAWGLYFGIVVGGYVSFPADLLPKALVFASMMLISHASVGLYQKRLREGLTGITIRIGVSACFVVVFVGVWYYLVPGSYLARGVMIPTLLLASTFSLLLRGLFLRLLVSGDALKRRVLVLGAGERAHRILDYQDEIGAPTFVIIGFIRLPSDRALVDEGRLIPMDRPLHALVDGLAADEIVVAADDRRKGLPVEALLEVKMSGTEVIDLLTFFEREHGIVNLDLLQPSWLIFSDGFRYGPIRDAIKRMFDLGTSSFLLLLAWPFMMLAAAAIWAESGFKGPILYRQTRVGQGGESFDVLKFRSMRVDAEADGKARWAQHGDARITRVGSFIRRTRIDELPQIFNVLMGKMSFVGPRPERPEFVTSLIERIPFYGERHRVKPGITGWAQICYPYGASEEDARRKLQFDLFYVKNYNLLFDLWILVQTAEVILWTRGAR